MKTYDKKVRAQALALLHAGKKPREVAAALKVQYSAVLYWRNAARKNGSGSKPDRRVADALTFLRHARAGMTAPASKLSRPELYALLALDSLEKP